jgi:hypothetical protein
VYAEATGRLTQYWNDRGHGPIGVRIYQSDDDPDSVLRISVCDVPATFARSRADAPAEMLKPTGEAVLEGSGYLPWRHGAGEAGAWGPAGSLVVVGRYRCAPGGADAVLRWQLDIQKEVMEFPGVLNHRMMVEDDDPSELTVFAEYSTLEALERVKALIPQRPLDVPRERHHRFQGRLIHAVMAEGL